MKNIILKFVLLIIILAFCIWLILFLGSTSIKEREKKEKFEEEIAQTKKTISDMAVKYNAITDWKKAFQENGASLGAVYTIQVEDALVKNNNHSILFISSVSDITRHDNKYYVHFCDWFDSLSIYFILECKFEQVKKILNESSKEFGDYSVVACISSIRRPMFGVNTEPIDCEDYEYVDIIYNDIVIEQSDIFIAYGRCLDLLYIGENGIWIKWEN